MYQLIYITIKNKKFVYFTLNNIYLNKLLHKTFKNTYIIDLQGKFEVKY